MAKHILFLVILSAVASLTGTRASAASAGPSFSCGHPEELESVVCSDAELSALDQRMAELYAAAQRAAIGDGRLQLRNAQRKWVKEGRTGCESGAWKARDKSIADCVRNHYTSRLIELAVAALVESPDLSLATLRAHAPQLAPLYEALVRYVTIDDSSVRSKTVVPLLTSMRAELPGEQAKWFASQKPPSPEEAALTDNAFGTYFVLLSLSGPATTSLTVPCGALLRRPGLVASFGSRFGGAIDGSIPQSDCAQMTPNLPELHRLLDALWQTQAACRGTIAFSTGRDYAVLQDAVMLHELAVLDQEEQKLSAGARQSIEQDRARAEAALHTGFDVQTKGAESALVKYYVDVLGVTPDSASRDAHSAVVRLSAAIRDSCGGEG